MGWRRFLSWRSLALVLFFSSSGYSLPTCQELQTTFQKCVHSNRYYGKYSDLLYDCDDYATYCNEVMGALYFQFSCSQWWKKTLTHAINKAACIENGIVHHLLLEPQNGKLIASWPARDGNAPSKEANRKLCEEVGLPDGKVSGIYEYALPRDKVNYDTQPRACAEWHGWVWRGSYASCWNCCQTEAKKDGRPNTAWLKHCKVYCWGLPGTPPGSPPVKEMFE